MSTLERGFKAWAERTALTIRRDMGLKPTERLDPQVLADHLGVVLLDASQIEGLTNADRTQLFETDPYGWSAATLDLGGTTTVIFNPRKSDGRRSSDIAHELAHVMLGHQPATLVLSEDGQVATRTFDQKQEDEANWFAWALLLPREALVFARRSRMLKAHIAAEFGVTESLVEFRLRMTGVNTQFRRG